MHSILSLQLLIASLASGVADREPPGVRILEDFVDSFASAAVSDAVEATASRRQVSGGVSAPGIFLHPGSRAADAVATFRAVEIPRGSAPERFLLILRLGLREGIPWRQGGGANGVRFSVAVDGEEVLVETVRGDGWRSRAIDLSRWLGRAVRIELRTNAIGGNSSYDWAVFGQPLLVGVMAVDSPDDFPPDTAGLGIARVVCESASRVRLEFGGVVETAELPRGEHLVPLHLGVRDRPSSSPVLAVESGRARLESFRLAPHLPSLEIRELALSSPLVHRGRPFRLVVAVENAGLGRVGPGASLEFATRFAPVGAQAAPPGKLRLAVDGLEAGARKTLRSPPISLPSRGSWTVEHRQQHRLDVRVFGPEPATGSPRARGAGVARSATFENGPIRALVASSTSRLSLVVEQDGAAYAIAETWTGNAWKRCGSLYPLARVVSRSDGRVRELPFHVSSVTSKGAELVIEGVAGTDGATAWPIRLRWEAPGAAARIRLRSELVAPAAVDLLAFSAPTVLAGDKAYGARKDFAIFPGLEFLEGDEPSSSERDLAYPMGDRRVPVAYKIATPVLAVEAEDTLTALLWDANQQWAAGERQPAARFLAPSYESGYEHVHLSLFAPSVGRYVDENRYRATRGYPLKAGETVRLEAWLVLDHRAHQPARSVASNRRRAGLVLGAVRHWFDVYGTPEPSPPPRSWDEERELCREAYFETLWREDPPGWSHCRGWSHGPFVGHSLPLILDRRSGTSEAVAREIDRRVDKMVTHHNATHGAKLLWRGSACHIVNAELPFFRGHVAESLTHLRQHALGILAGRENGLWVWRPRGAKHASLGVAGDHTLGQVARNAIVTLRAARLTGDAPLRERALDAMRQMERYAVPRGAQMWECPLYQPDILAAAYAIRAYCEAYRLTGDTAHLAEARYWAWTGLPFFYTWEIQGSPTAYPTMRYNVISVIGSTFHHHSWLGLPVVWCGLVYAYALLDLAEFDSSFDWKRIARGMLHSAMWQQYTDGPSKGCYPDSWSLAENEPRPADINPENILMIGFRLEGQSTEIRFARIEDGGGVGAGHVFLNSAADISGVKGKPSAGRLEFDLRSTERFGVYSLLAPVAKPSTVVVDGKAVKEMSGDALQEVRVGWQYDVELRGVVLKTTGAPDPLKIGVTWK